VPEAVAYKECVQECVAADNEGCFMSCYEQHPDGIPAFAPRMACIDIYCSDADACNTEPLSACEVCLNQNCAEEYVALDGTPAGFLLWHCMLECPEADQQACWEECQNEYPSAAPQLEVYLACSLASCGAECG
jgi:hypothetical protein